jgi:hypothetical protein
MEKREDVVLDMDIYRLERNGARENAGSNPEDVSTGEGMAATLSGTGNTKPLDHLKESCPLHPCRTLSHFQGKGSDPP